MTTAVHSEENPNSQTCDHCGTEFDNTVMDFGITEDEQEICDNCCRTNFTYSDLQGAYISRAQRTTLHDHIGYVSRAWRNNNCYEANSLDGLWFADEYERDEYDDQNSRGAAIYSYHETTPMDVHDWPTITPCNSLCFGVELEMENRHDSSGSGMEQLSEALGGKDGGIGGGAYILMADGSLGESGVELITCPYTLDAHQALFRWDKVLDAVKDIGQSGAGTPRCGMHVHVNRKAISALTLGKMLVFVNAAANTSLVERVAQRRETRWAKRTPKKISDGKAMDSDKYEALHVGYATIEFRIFRGNLRADRVLKNIEFCHSVVSYCKQASVQALKSDTDYLMWLQKNRGTYPNLVKFLSESKVRNRLSASALPADEDI